MIELDQQGSNKVQVTQTPQSAPHQCCNCGFSGYQEGRYFIDFGVDIEYYGTLILCSECFAETAKILGWITPEIADGLQEQITNLGIENLELREIKEKYDAVVLATRPFVGNVDPGLTGSMDHGEVDEVSGLQPRFSDSESTDTDSGTSESVVSEGLSDLLSSTESVLNL